MQPCDDGLIRDKQRFSTRHQLLVYVNLFETNKAYFMNCMRVSALQNLLLYAKSLYTNADCTRILCDEWIEIRFIDSDSAQKMLSAVLYLRSSLDKLFKIRLEDRQKKFDMETGEELVQTNSRSNKERAKCLERLLKKKLSEFTDSSLLYSMRRVLPAELSTIFVKNFTKEETEGEKEKKIINDDLKPELRKHFEADTDLKVNETKGGYRITDYLTYNCLVSDATLSILNEYSGTMQRHWKCSTCLKDFVFNLKERMEHEVDCQLKSKIIFFNRK